MTSKELVKMAIEKKNPPKTPLLYFNTDFEKTDVKLIGYDIPDGFDDQNGKLSEWGFVWQSHDNTMGQPTNPPITDWSLFERFIAPDPNAKGRFDRAQQEMEQYKDRYLIGDLAITGFNMVHFIRGFEDTLMDLYTDRENIENLIDMVMDFESGVARNFAKLGCDAIYFGDDWGTQNGLMISPELWREVFKPRYKKQFDEVHELGLKVYMHSCGQIHDIMEDLIEVGVDILNLNQPDIFGIEKVGKEFGGRVCFNCPVDHQTVAINGTPEEIFDYVKRLNQNLGCFGGGFIGYIEEYSSVGMTDIQFDAIKQAFESIGYQMEGL